MGIESNIDRQLLDTISAVTVVGTLVNMLPSIAAIFTIIWTSFRIYETNTVQDWVNRGTNKKDKP